MFRLQLGIAVAITVVWAGVVIAAVSTPANPGLVTLATLVTPVMLLPAGWLFAAPVLRQRRITNGNGSRVGGRSDDGRDES